MRDDPAMGRDRPGVVAVEGVATTAHQRQQPGRRLERHGLRRSARSHAHAINSKSLIVGQYRQPRGFGSVAFVRENDTMTGLEGDGGEAFAASDAGQSWGSPQTWIPEIPGIETHAVLG
jgi:hypothetical protein